LSKYNKRRKQEQRIRVKLTQGSKQEKYLTKVPTEMEQIYTKKDPLPDEIAELICLDAL
jgi:hypothetical protein